MKNHKRLTKDELASLLREKGRGEICEILNINQRTLTRLISKHNLTGIFGSQKLNEYQVESIRSLYSSNQHTQQELADLFGVSQSLIAKIVNFDVHKKVKGISISGQAETKVGFRYGNTRYRLFG